MGRISKKINTESQQSDALYMQHAQNMLLSQDEDRMIYLAGDVNEITITSVIAQLFSFAKKDSQKPIYVVISTYGGSVDEMFSLYDAIKFVNAPVYTIGIGKIMSAGVLLLASGKKNKRLIGKNARIMIHPIFGGSMGNVFEQQNELNEMKRMQKQLNECLANETEKSLKEIENLMKTRIDTYLTPDEAIKFGIVDNLIGGITKLGNV
jgi:ATP-dependent Clp protease protease subunit